MAFLHMAGNFSRSYKIIYSILSIKKKNILKIRIIDLKENNTCQLLLNYVHVRSLLLMSGSSYDFRLIYVVRLFLSLSLWLR